MAIVLTNGTYYIATNKRGRIIKTPIIEDAQIFYSVNVAMRKKLKLPGKCKGYYPYDTEDITCGYSSKKKRKSFSRDERRIIYNNSGGRCELCGQQLLLENMTLDHIVPLSMGGEDSMENLQALCYACNQLKSNIMPDDFIGRIIKIFLYQMGKKCREKGKDSEWKVLEDEIEKMG